MLLKSSGKGSSTQMGGGLNRPKRLGVYSRKKAFSKEKEDSGAVSMSVTE